MPPSPEKGSQAPSQPPRQPPKTRPLTVKQERFIDLVPLSPSLTQAARDALYSPASAKQIAHENMTKPYLAAAIEEAKLASTSQKVATVRERKEMLSKLLADPQPGPHPAHVVIGAIAELNKMERVYGEPPARDSALEWLLELRKLMVAGPQVEALPSPEDAQAAVKRMLGQGEGQDTESATHKGEK